MSLITNVDTIEQAKVAKESGVKEVIVGNMLFSRFGKVNPNRCNSFLKELKTLGLRVIFEWDILMTETVFIQKTNALAEVDFSLVDAIRLQDPGALQWIKDNFPNLKIQLNLENGNHNLIGIQKWIELSGKNLERLILSIELPKKKLEEYCKVITTPVEFFVAGRILLFYTPRNLVSPYLIDHEDDKEVSVNKSFIEITGSSEESPHKGFPITENLHGTFMFNTKDQYLCDHVDELKSSGVEYFRFDVRHFDNPEIVEAVCAQLIKPSEVNSDKLKALYDRPVIRGFYHVNKSDVLFKKLKNQRTQRKDTSFVGDVLDVKKTKHLAILVKSKTLTLEVGDELALFTPDGKEKSITLDNIYNSQGDRVSKVSKNQIAFVKHVSGVSVKTTVYKK